MTNSFEKLLTELEVFKELNGHINISLRDEANKNLANKLHNVRNKYKKGNLKENEIEALEKLGISWEPLKDNFLKHCKELSYIFKKNIPLKSNPSVYNFLLNVRKKTLSNKLKDYEIEILNDMKLEEIIQGQFKKREKKKYVTKINREVFSFINKKVGTQSRDSFLSDHLDDYCNSRLKIDIQKRTELNRLIEKEEDVVSISFYLYDSNIELFENNKIFNIRNSIFNARDFILSVYLHYCR